MTINLLPWREMKRKRDRKIAVIMLSVSLASALIIVLLLHHQNRKKPNTQQQNNQPQNRTERPEQPLEKFPLETMKFSGSLQQGIKVWGLIHLPDGEIIKVKPGDYLGKHSGKIMRIDNDYLLLEETQQAAGIWKKVTRTLKL